MDSSRMETSRRRGGQPGNKNAVKNRTLRELLAEIIEADGGAKLREGLERLLDRAAEGDLAALTFIADRLDGKPRQAVEMSGDSGGPIQIEARPELTKEEWLRAFAPGAAQVIENEPR